MSDTARTEDTAGGLASAYVRLAAGLAVEVRAGQVFVHGRVRQYRYSGPLAHALLTAAGIRTGTSTTADLVPDLTADRDAVDRALGLLRARGVLEFSPEPFGDRARDGFGVHLDRNVPVRLRAATAERLAEATVTVRGPDTETTTRLARLLRDRVGTVRVLPPTGPDGGADGGADPTGTWPDLTVDVEDESVPTPPGGARRAPGGPVLRVVRGRCSAAVGPILDVPGGRCSACFTAPEDAPSGAAGATGTRDTGAVADRATAAVAAGLAAATAIHYLGAFGASSYWRAVQVWRADTGRCESREVPVGSASGGCEVCGTFGAADGAAPLVRAEFAAPPPRGGRTTPFRFPSALERVSKAQRYVPVRRPVADGPGADGAALSWALRMAVGLVPAGSGRARRFSAPSTGGLGLVRAYVAPGHGPADHVFDRASGRLARVLEPGPATAPTDDGDVRVVVVGDVFVAERQCGPQGRRIVVQDAGFALAQLALACDAAGLDLTPLDRAETLDLVADHEPADEWDEIVAGVRIRPRPAGSPARTGWSRSGLERLVRRRASAYAFAGAAAPERLAAVVREAIRLGGEDRDGLGLELWTAASGGDGPRLVRLDPAGAIGPDAAGDPAGVALFLAQRELEIPALVLVSGDVTDAVRRRGEDGLRRLLLASSSLAAALTLAATADGLASGPFTGLPPLVTAPAGAGPVPAVRVLAGVALGLPGPGGNDGADGSVVSW